MSDKPEKEVEAYSNEEAAKRRDEVIRRMANTPPKPAKSQNDAQRGAVKGRQRMK